MSKVWSPLDLSTLPDCAMLACDPSITALGLVWLDITRGKVTIHEAQKLSAAPTERKGWDDTFFRADLIEALLDALVDSWLGAEDRISDAASMFAVHEAPPTGGGDFVRTESSVLTGKGFRSVALDWKMNILQVVTPQSHKKLICGNHLASKKEHHDALKKLIPDMTGGEKIKNEATRDALSVGLYAANRLGAKARS